MNSQVRHGAQRPVNLNLFRFHFPVAAITSITHRITGVLLFFAIWFPLYLLHLAVSGAADVRFSEITSSMWGGGLLVILIAGTSFHFAAGVKHLLLDLHIGESLGVARALSWSVWVVTSLCTALAILAAGW